MENLAFTLIEQGHKEDAMALLFSDKYKKQKKIYAHGMEEFSVGLSNSAINVLKEEQFRAFLHISIALTAIPLLVISWFIVFFSVRKWKRILIKNNELLARQTSEVTVLNRDLDQKVTDRTAELTKTNKELQQEVLVRKQIEQELKKEKDEQKELIKQLSSAQEQLLQSEKMASIGQLAAGVAHEINNPVGYISSNIKSLKKYIAELIDLLTCYEQAEDKIR